MSTNNLLKNSNFIWKNQPKSILNNLKIFLYFNFSLQTLIKTRKSNSAWHLNYYSCKKLHLSYC